MYPHCVSLCKEQNSVINQDSPPYYTVINPGNTPVVKLYRGVKGGKGSATTTTGLLDYQSTQHPIPEDNSLHI